MCPPQKIWRRWRLGKCVCLDCWPPDLDPDKWQKMVEWMGRYGESDKSTYEELNETDEQKRRVLKDKKKGDFCAAADMGGKHLLRWLGPVCAGCGKYSCDHAWQQSKVWIYKKEIVFHLHHNKKTVIWWVAIVATPAQQTADRVAIGAVRSVGTFPERFLMHLAKMQLISEFTQWDAGLWDSSYPGSLPRGLSCLSWCDPETCNSHNGKCSRLQ